MVLGWWFSKHETRKNGLAAELLRDNQDDAESTLVSRIGNQVKMLQ
jgi:hypothetical protein